MNFKILIGILFAISVINAQATQKEVLEAINFARTNPLGVAGSLTNRIRRTGKKGVAGDENCWQEAADYLRVQGAVKPISEEIGLDMAAYTQSKDMFENIRALKHAGSDKSSVEDRMTRYGKFTGNYLFFELLSFFKQTKAVSADKIVHLFITDCGNKDRSHRKLIFNENVTQMGASIFYSNKQTWITMERDKPTQPPNGTMLPTLSREEKKSTTKTKLITLIPLRTNLEMLRMMDPLTAQPTLTQKSLL